MIADDVTRLMNRFDSLAYRTMRSQKVKPASVLPAIDPAVEEQNHMAEFTRAPQTRKRWLPWLRAQHRLAAAAVRQTGMTGGAATQFAVGYEAALNDLIEKIERWGQAVPEIDETRSMRPLEGA